MEGALFNKTLEVDETTKAVSNKIGEDLTKIYTTMYLFTQI
jgi:hypothetical protein